MSRGLGDVYKRQVLNFSVLDGWWLEGYREGAGWALTEKRTYQNQDHQDQLDAATIYSIRKRTGLWGVDLILFGAAGIVGCVLAFLALFSEHPAVSSNFLLLVFHPGQLLILPYIIYCVRKGKKCWYLTLNLVVLTLFMVLFPLIPQRFDLAVVPLALCLLIRSASNLILTSKKK